MHVVSFQRAEEVQGVCGRSSAPWIWGWHQRRRRECHPSYSALHLQVRVFSSILHAALCPQSETWSATYNLRWKTRPLNCHLAQTCFQSWGAVVDIDFLQFCHWLPFVQKWCGSQISCPWHLLRNCFLHFLQFVRSKIALIDYYLDLFRLFIFIQNTKYCSLLTIIFYTLKKSG